MIKDFCRSYHFLRIYGNVRPENTYPERRSGRLHHGMALSATYGLQFGAKPRGKAQHTWHMPLCYSKKA